MNGRQEVLVYLVAGGLLAAGLIAVLKRSLPSGTARPSAIDPGNWYRWFGSGFGRVRPLWISWLVLAISAAIYAFCSAHNAWIAARGTRDPRLWFLPPPGLAPWPAELRWLGTAALGGGSSMIPFPATAALSVIPLLLRARRSSGFPYRRGNRVLNFWFRCGLFAWLLFVSAWIASFLPSVNSFIERSVGNAFGSSFFLVTLLWLFLGFGLVLPLLYAALDDRIDAELSKPARKLTRTFLTLAGIQLLTVIGANPSSFVVVAATSIRGGLRGGTPGILSFADTVLALTLVPFLVTATLVCMTQSSLRSWILGAWLWWKKEYLFFFALLLATGLAAGTTSLFLRAAFSAWQGGEYGRTVAYYSVLAVARLAVSILSFCFLLGNWLEYESPQASAEEAR